MAETFRGIELQRFSGQLSALRVVGASESHVCAVKRSLKLPDLAIDGKDRTRLFPES